MITFRSFLLRIKSFSDKIFRENEDIHYLLNIFFPSEIGAVCEIMLRNMVQPDRPQTTIRHMRISCWLPKAADIQTKYIILIVLPRQKRLRERALMLRLNLHFLSY